MGLRNDGIIIIGAGPAGMSCAMELHNAGKSSIIIEKDSQVGGLGKTLVFKEGRHVFRTDFGPHRFFSKNRYLYRFIEGLLGKDWVLVRRQTRQFIEGKFYDYPINAMQALRNIGLFRAALMGISYVFSAMQYRLFRKKIASFQDYIYNNFGKMLGNFNMINYTEKVWGIPCTRIHPDWARQRIKGLNLVTALKNAVLPKKGDSPKTLVDHFYYPMYGTGTIYETITARIKGSGSRIMTESRPVGIYHRDFAITRIEAEIRGKKRFFAPETLVTSIPLNLFVRLLRPSPPERVMRALDRLKWRSQVNLFITLDKERVTRDNWIYFPNREIPFGRISEMKNFSSRMSPRGKTSLFVEYFVDADDTIWNMGDKQLFELTMRHFKRLNFFSEAQVRKYYILKRNYVYPVYDLHYPSNLVIVKEYLDRFTNLLYIGRPGRFQYTNQDHSLEMGIAAAKGIVEGRKPDFDNIGTESEYFEKGVIRKA